MCATIRLYIAENEVLIWKDRFAYSSDIGNATAWMLRCSGILWKS